MTDRRYLSAIIRMKSRRVWFDVEVWKDGCFMARSGRQRRKET
jgi:hypothetical protein